MRKIAQIIALTVAVACGTGCATPYLSDRCHDAADVITAGVGIGVGAKARVGPLQTGILFDVPVVGLRGGELVGMTPGSCMPQSIDGAFVHIGGESFVDCTKHRGKQYWASTVENDACGGFPPFVMVLDEDTPAPYYFTQIECVIGFLGTVRLGFNPGELLDFVLGWTTLDIFNDDSSGTFQREHADKLEKERQKNLTLEERRQLREAYLKRQRELNGLPGDESP